MRCHLKCLSLRRVPSSVTIGLRWPIYCDDTLLAMTEMGRGCVGSKCGGHGVAFKCETFRPVNVELGAVINETRVLLENVCCILFDTVYSIYAAVTHVRQRSLCVSLLFIKMRSTRYKIRFLRCFWDPSRVPRIENRVRKIRKLSRNTSKRICNQYYEIVIMEIFRVPTGSYRVPNVILKKNCIRCMLQVRLDPCIIS